MTDGAPAPLVFDAVLLVHAASEARVAGLRLLERAAFTLASAGARRLLCVGTRPTVRLRLPELPIAWTASVAAPHAAAWTANASPSVIVMDAAVVADRDAIEALAVAPGDVLATEGPAFLWRCPRELLAAIVACTAPDLDGSRYGGAVAPAAAATIADVQAHSWRPPIDSLVTFAAAETGRAAAERALFARLGRAGDGWFTRRVDRRMSRAFTRVLLPTGVTPNAVTYGSIAIGVFAGALFATGWPSAVLAGALLFLASTIIDGCDGELARLTFRESAFGARLDVVGDNVVHLFLFAGIPTGLYRHHHDPRIAVAGGLLVVGVLAAMAAVYACLIRHPPQPRQRALFEAFASREFAYLLVVLTLAGRLEWFLWISVAGTYVFVVALLALGARRPPAISLG